MEHLDSVDIRMTEVFSQIILKFFARQWGRGKTFQYATYWNNYWIVPKEDGWRRQELLFCILYSFSEPSGERYFSGKYIYSELHFDLIEKWSLPWERGTRIFLSALPFSPQTPEAPARSLSCHSLLIRKTCSRLIFPACLPFKVAVFQCQLKTAF